MYLYFCLCCLDFRYIRVYGVHNTVNKVFHLVHFECLYSNTSYELGQDGVIGKFWNLSTFSAFSSITIIIIDPANNWHGTKAQ